MLDLPARKEGVAVAKISPEEEARVRVWRSPKPPSIPQTLSLPWSVTVFVCGGSIYISARETFWYDPRQITR